MMGCHRHCPRFLIIAAEFFACKFVFFYLSIIVTPFVYLFLFIFIFFFIFGADKKHFRNYGSSFFLSFVHRLPLGT